MFSWARLGIRVNPINFRGKKGGLKIDPVQFRPRSCPARPSSARRPISSTSRASQDQAQKLGSARPTNRPSQRTSSPGPAQARPTAMPTRDSKQCLRTSIVNLLFIPFSSVLHTPNSRFFFSFHTSFLDKKNKVL